MPDLQSIQVFMVSPGLYSLQYPENTLHDPAPLWSSECSYCVQSSNVASQRTWSLPRNNRMWACSRLRNLCRVFSAITSLLELLSGPDICLSVAGNHARRAKTQQPRMACFYNSGTFSTHLHTTPMSCKLLTQTNWPWLI